MKAEQRRSQVIREAHPDAIVLASKLREIDVNAVIGYEELNAAIGADVTNGSRPRLYAARRMVLRDDNMVFECVRGTGLMRLADKDVLRVAASGFKRVRQTCRRELRKIRTVQYDGLDADDKTSFNAQVSMFGVLAQITKPKQVKALEDHISQQESQRQLSLAATLAVFQS